MSKSRQAFVHQLQVSDFVDERALLRVDDVGVGGEVNAQHLGPGLGYRGNFDDLFLLDLDDLGYFRNHRLLDGDHDGLHGRRLWRGRGGAGSQHEAGD